MDAKKTRVFVIHYSPLFERKNYLTKNMVKDFDLKFVTEKDVSLRKYKYSKSDRVFGISRKKIGMDQGINSRSLVFSRRKARIQGYLYYFISFIGPINRKYPNLTTGSLNEVKRLENNALEVQAMHFRALELGISEDNEWIFIIEDDAVLNHNENYTHKFINRIAKDFKANKTWIDLNNGAGLKLTKTDRISDKNNLFRVRPPTTRCAVAYMISKDLATEVLKLIDLHGVPEWLYIDNLYQVATRKLRAKSFWQDPPLFSQGSETGVYESGFDIQRSKS